MLDEDVLVLDEDVLVLVLVVVGVLDVESKMVGGSPSEVDDDACDVLTAVPAPATVDVHPASSTTPAPAASTSARARPLITAPCIRR